MGTERNSTHTVVVRTENRGIRVVIGALVLYMWLRWWWTGSLFASVASAVPSEVQDGQFGSVTGTLLPIAVDLLGFVGSLVISVGGFGWRAIWDLISGILETIGLFSKQEAATQAAVDAATESATVSAASHAGAAAWPDFKPVQTYSKPIPKRRVDLDKVAAALQSQDTELDDLDTLVRKLSERLNRLNEHADAVDKVLNVQTEINEATRKELAGIPERLETFDRRLELAASRDLEFMRGEVVKSLNTRYLPLESKVDDLAKLLIERIEALEQTTIKKPPTRKATRQAPAKRSTKAKA